MAAEDHLQVGQFGTMSPHALTKYWDPNMRNPQTLREWAGYRYIENLAADIKKHGMQNPVQLYRPTPRPSYPHPKPLVIYDGHHRVLAAIHLGLKEVPYRVVSGVPGEQ